MTKLTFWDEHNGSSPEAYTECEGRYLKAVYILDDSWDGETVGEYDYGVFNCGFGDNTMNTGNAFGKVWKEKYPTTPQGYAYKNPVTRVVNGKTLYQHRMRLRYPDTLQWVIHKECNGEVWLYKPQLLETDGCRKCYGRGTKGYNVTGWSFNQILDNCRKDGFNGNELRQREGVQTRVIGPRIEHRVLWSVDYDGQSIVQLLIAKPKMTYAEITNVIVNEGGVIDEKGIIHRGTAKY